MDPRNSTPGPLAPYRGAIPGHLRELRAIAEAAGIVVRFGLGAVRYGSVVYEDDDDKPLSLCARLIGSPAAFERAGLVPQGFQCVRYRRIRRGPFPLSFARTGPDQLCADMTEDQPQLVEKRRGVEVAMYKGWNDRTERAYWGRPQAVAAALKVPAEKLSPKARGWSHSGYDQILGEFRWHARFYPSGGVRLVWRDDPPAKTPAGAKERGKCYSSAEEFAASCERLLRVSTRVVIREISGELEHDEFGECTIRYDAETVEAVSAALDHACQLLQASMPRVAKRRTNEAHNLDGARADAGFQAFLARVTDPRRGEEST